MALTDAQRVTFQAQQQTLPTQISEKRQEIFKIAQTINQLSSDLMQYPETIFFTGVPTGIDQDDPPVTRQITYEWPEIEEALDLGAIVRKITELRKMMDQLEDATQQLAAG